jgi:glycosyltransferase involved in cell wall biosynthesis
MLGRTTAEVWCPSQWLARKVPHSLLRDCAVSVVANPVDVTVFAPRPKEDARAGLGLTAKEVVLYPAVAGSANQFKDWAAIVSLAQALRAPGREFIAFGASHDESADVRVERAVASPEVMARWYAAADIVVYPTLADTAPLAPLEAAACERPMVATRVGGVEEEIDHGRTGLLTPPGDHTALIAAVSELLNDRQRADQMGRAGRVAVAARNALTIVRDDWLKRLSTGVSARAGE